WSADGRILFMSRDPKTQLGALWIVQTAGDRKPTRLTPAGILHNESFGSISPDGRWLAYQSDENSGPPQIYVRPFPDGPGKYQVSTAGGGFPEWRHDNRELYYVDLSNKILAVDVKSNGTTFEPGTPKVLMDSGATSLSHNGGPYTPYAPSPDG